MLVFVTIYRLVSVYNIIVVIEHPSPANSKDRIAGKNMNVKTSKASPT